ncbi:Uncharacterized protein QTN25_001209 [Entamoeba marina]
MSRLFQLKNAPSGVEKIEDKIKELEEKLREVQNDPMYGRRKNEINWEILQINNERTRYVYDLYRNKEISRDLYTYCLNHNIIDGKLIAKWKKPGFEKVCCLQCIQKKPGSNSVCICRVPRRDRNDDSFKRCSCCGCTGCCSGGNEEDTEEEELVNEEKKMEEVNEEERDKEDKRESRNESEKERDNAEQKEDSEEIITVNLGINKFKK